MLLSKKDVEKAVVEYFKEHSNIQDLMCYGASNDEGLNDISEPYAEILENLGFKNQGHYAEDGMGDGKYDVYLEIPSITKDRIEIPVKAWYDAERVITDICDLLEDYGYLSTHVEYSVEMSLILDGEYYEDSDIHIATFDNFNDAYTLANQIDVQDPELYECYIYAINTDDSNILDSYRVF